MQSSYTHPLSMASDNQTARMEPSPALSGLQNPNVGFRGSADAG